MRRQEKFPSTNIFHYFNANPKDKITTDCVVRAIAIALCADKIGSGENWGKLIKQKWGVVLESLVQNSIKTGYMYDDTTGYTKFIEDHYGFIKHKQPRHEDGTKFTVREFIADHPKGVYLVYMPSHMTVVINGVAYDIWDVTKSHTRVGNYWEKP